MRKYSYIRFTKRNLDFSFFHLQIFMKHINHLEVLFHLCWPIHPTKTLAHLSLLNWAVTAFLHSLSFPGGRSASIYQEQRFTVKITLEHWPNTDCCKIFLSN